MGVRTGRSSSVAWRRSSYSADQGNCLEISTGRSFVLVRDSRDHCGPRLVLTLDQWRAMVRRMRHSDLEPD